MRAHAARASTGAELARRWRLHQADVDRIFSGCTITIFDTAILTVSLWLARDMGRRRQRHSGAARPKPLSLPSIVAW